MLHDFLATNRTLLIERCRLTVAARSAPKAAEHELLHGIPVFLNQLIRALANNRQLTLASAGAPDPLPEGAANEEVTETAALHGRDLLDRGFTIEQVVRDYGDVCQAVTRLAFESGAQIAADEFHTFNRCLDDAIAAAVTEYARHSSLSGELVSDALNSRLGPLVQEL